MAKAGDLVELLQTRKCPDCQLTDVDLVHSDLRDADLRELSFSGPTNNALLPTTPLFPTTHLARVVHQHQHRLEINQPPPSQTQCCELRQLTKSRQWHTTIPTTLMLSTMTRLNHSLSETFKGAISSS